MALEKDPTGMDDALLQELHGWMDNVFLDNNYAEGFVTHIRGNGGTKAAAAYSLQVLDKVLESRPAYLVDLMGEFGWEVDARHWGGTDGLDVHLEFIADLRDAIQEFHDRIGPGYHRDHEVKPLADELAGRLYAKWLLD